MKIVVFSGFCPISLYDQITYREHESRGYSMVTGIRTIHEMTIKNITTDFEFITSEYPEWEPISSIRDIRYMQDGDWITKEMELSLR